MKKSQLTSREQGKKMFKRNSGNYNTNTSNLSNLYCKKMSEQPKVVNYWTDHSQEKLPECLHKLNKIELKKDLESKMQKEPSKSKIYDYSYIAELNKPKDYLPRINKRDI